MKFYFAPMEGLTGYVLRNAYNKFYHDIDKYFTPFIASTGLNHKERNDVLPEHNEGLNVVPQILTNKSEDFLEIAGKLKEYGYTAVNLNLGCPSGTVTAKRRGAGFLAYPGELDHFLDEIYTRCPLKISVKTRIGTKDYQEWQQLQEIFVKYPIEELIIHPRLLTDYYKNSPDWDIFETAAASVPFPVCYNGDLFAREDFVRFQSRFPKTQQIMLGRGLLQNPALAGEMKRAINQEKTGSPEQQGISVKSRELPDQEHGQEGADLEKLKAFHDEVLDGYCEIMSGQKNTLFKMKELWVYLGRSFPGEDKILKKIRKADALSEYKIEVGKLFHGKN